MQGAVVHIDIREWLVLAMYLHVHVEVLADVICCAQCARIVKKSTSSAQRCCSVLKGCLQNAELSSVAPANSGAKAESCSVR
eukprot:6489455-Amphidinium_carterae.1